MKKKIGKSVSIYIGTSGWHYTHWMGTFYPKEITGYNELTYHSKHFNTVENNSSFYRISTENTYKTWLRMTPPGYVFSLKLNKVITHIHRLELNDETREKITYIVDSIQVLGERLGAIVIQLPPSFKYDLDRVEKFLKYFMSEIQKRKYTPNVAIEFRNKYWFTEEAFDLLKKYNVALVAGQSSRYPLAREITADCAYIRMHGPGKLFASPYSSEELKEWADYIRSIVPKVRTVYIYFNNDFHGYALQNATELMEMLGVELEYNKETVGPHKT